MALLTVGHGALERSDLVALLTGAGVQAVVDVRRFPGSRRNPDMAREALATWLPGAGIDYRWEERLGGRRHQTSAERARSPDTWWQVAAFSAYAAHTRTEAFRAAFAEVLATARERRVAVMCAETVWWRCHRRIIADVAALTTDLEPAHLMHNGTVASHRPAEGARVQGGDVLWDGRPARTDHRGQPSARTNPDS